MKSNWQKLSHSSVEYIENIQNAKFRFFMHHLLPYQPFAQQFFKKHKLRFKDFETIDQIKKIPFTSKLDILPTQENPGKSKDFILQPDEKLIKKYAPLATLIKIALKKITHQDYLDELEYEFKPIHIHFTTGRSSDQIPFLYTSKDLEGLNETGRRIYDVIGANKDDIVMNAFPFAPHLAFWLGVHTTRANKLLSLQSGGGKILGTQKIIEAMVKLKITIIVGTPGFCYHMFKEAVEQGKDFSSLRIILMGGEKVSPALREKIKDLLTSLGAKNTKVLSTYAMTESKTAWAQCHEESGYHLYPDMGQIELVDENGKEVPEGNSGEIVFTALDWRGSAVFRYKTGDKAKALLKTTCEFCGRTTPRLHYDIDRMSEYKDLDLTKIKGENVNLNIFYTLIHEIKGIDEWQVEIGKINNDPFDLDVLTVHISLNKGFAEKEITEELTAKIQGATIINPVISVHERKVMVEMLGLNTKLKEDRIIDRRKELAIPTESVKLKI